MMGGLRRTLAASVALAALGITDVAGAQSPRATPSREQLNPAAQAPPQRARSRDLFSAPVGLPCPLSASDVTFKLDEVEIVGSTIPAERMRPAYANLIGQTIPVSRICEIRDRLSLILFREGLLARVEAPAQTITGGKLQLVVVEAKIVSVRVRGDIGPGQDKVEAYLEKLRGLTPFDLDTAQRYLLLANEVPGVRLSAALRPAAEGRGAIDLEVQVERDPYQVLGAVQNTGSETLGPWSVLARADFNSFTRFGERTSLIAYSTFPEQEQWIVQAIEEARFGSSGLLGRLSVAYGKSKPGDVLEELGLEGDSLTITPELRYPIIKLKRHTLEVGAGLDYVNQTTEFPGGGMLADDKLRVLWLGASGDYQRFLNDEALLVNGRWVAQVRKGLSGLGASEAGQPALSRIEGKPDAWVARFTGDSQLSGRYGAIAVRAQGQWANDPLLSYEEMAVGDLTIGRGYEPAVIAGDRVIGAELKISTPELRYRDRWSCIPFAFVDGSRVENLDTGSQTRTLRSAGVGVDARLPFGLRASLAWAHPFDKPFPQQPDKPDDRVLFQLVLIR